MKIDAMILIERMKAISAMHHAAMCVSSLEKALPTCETPTERRCVQRLLRKYKADAVRSSDRLLQLSASDNAVGVA